MNNELVNSSMETVGARWKTDGNSKRSHEY